MELRRGDLVEVQWIDIYEDVTGNPSKADVFPRVSIGYFWCIREGKHGTVFVTTTTMDGESEGESGYCAYPVGCVVKVKMIRRRKGKHSEPASEWPQPARDGAPSERLTDPGNLAQQRRASKVRGTRDVRLNVSEVPTGGESQA